MKIEISSQFIKPEDLIRYIDKEYIETGDFKLEEVDNTQLRPLETVIIVVIIKTLGIGTILAATINAIKDYKITKLKNQSQEKENSLERVHDISKLKYERETEFQKIIIQGLVDLNKEKIQIIGNNREKLILDKPEIIKELKLIGAHFNENELLLPLNLKESDFQKIYSILNINSIQEIVHREIN